MISRARRLAAGVALVTLAAVNLPGSLTRPESVILSPVPASPIFTVPVERPESTLADLQSPDTGENPDSAAAEMAGEIAQTEEPVPNQPALGEHSNPAPRAGPDALRFAFPTPQPAPVSAWRPALYPAPWALTPYDHFYFLRPIGADEINWPTPDYRYGGVFFQDIVHGGVDIPAPVGTPVLAAGSGKVTWTGYGLNQGIYDPEDPYGLAILIRHDFGFQGATLYSVYAHLDEILVSRGQQVAGGGQIGFSGETGKVTGPHLHFEVRLEADGFFTTRNPELWLVPPQGWGVLAGRVMNSGGLKLDSQPVEVHSQEGGLIWRAFTYGNGNVHADPFYRENLVISDLPAGIHEIHIRYLGKDYAWPVEIGPGLVSYFTFRGRSGFTDEPPPIPGADFSP